MTTTTNMAAELRTLVVRFTLGAIGERGAALEAAAAEALELTKDRPDEAPEKMCAYTMDYASGRQTLLDASRAKVRRLELERVKDAANDLDTAMGVGMIRLHRLLNELQDYDLPDDTEAIFASLEKRAHDLATLLKLEEL